MDVCRLSESSTARATATTCLCHVESGVYSASDRVNDVGSSYIQSCRLLPHVYSHIVAVLASPRAGTAGSA